MQRAEELIRLLRNSDPRTRISDPVARHKLVGELKRLAERFGRPVWTEPPEWGH